MDGFECNQIKTPLLAHGHDPQDPVEEGGNGVHRPIAQELEMPER